MKLIGFLEKYTNKKIIFVGIIIIALFNVFFLPKFPQLFSENEFSVSYVLDLKFSYSTETTYNTLSKLGNKGRNIYKLSGIFIDTPYAVIYGLIYAIIVLFLLNLNKLYRFKYLSLIPLIIGFFDVLENLGIIIMISNYPKKLENLVNITSLFTSLKWIFAGTTFLIIFTLLIRYFIKRKNTI